MAVITKPPPNGCIDFCLQPYSIIPLPSAPQSTEANSADTLIESNMIHLSKFPAFGAHAVRRGGQPA